MGADQSTVAGAEAESIRHADDLMQQGYEEAKRAAQKRKQKRKVAGEGTHGEQSPAVVSDIEPGEVTPDVQADSITVPIRPGNSQSTSDTSDILAAFQPRKERVLKKPRIGGKATEQEFLEFGNESRSQTSAREPTRERPTLDTTSDSINVSRKTHSATSSMSSGVPKVQKVPTKAPASSSKRPADTAPDGRRISFSAISSIKIPKRTSVASPQSPDAAEDNDRPNDTHPPKWYRDTQVPKNRNRNDSQVDVMLLSLRGEMSKVRDSKGPHQDPEMQKIFTEVRTKLHTIIFEEVNPQVLKRNRMLDSLPEIFDEQSSHQWPFDIRADAKELYAKWSRQDFATDIFRGIKFSVSVKGTKRDGGDSIDRDYTKVVPAKTHGNNGLVNGQWWPRQICALRDGAHGVTQGGIHGAKGQGAYSCIISGGGKPGQPPYPDVDDGNLVLYCGTDSDNGEPSVETKYMLQSINNNHPVRFIRSHQASESPYAPKVGFRYDGLYDVTDVERLDPANSMRQRHRFRLVRVEGQDPIRGGDGPETRPTVQEIDQYEKHQRLSGRSKGQD